jgi:hypothetical protein
MRKPSKKKSQISEIEETASGIVAAATQDIELTAEQIADATKKVVHAAAVAIGKLGGAKGGKPAAKSSLRKPPQIAKKGARARSLET